MARIEARLQKLPVEPVEIAAYEGIAPERQIDAARELAGSLTGARVLFVSSAPPEPADTSRSVAALLRGLGVHADRALLHGDSSFSRATRLLSSHLDGADTGLGEPAWRALREASEAAAVAYDTRPYDSVIVHGAAGVALVEGRRSDGASWTWRTGRDLSDSYEAAALVNELLGAYSSLSFALPGFALPGHDEERIAIFRPGFDPVAPAQRDMSPARMSRLASDAGVDLTAPLVSQTGRLDIAADPLAAVEAWRVARGEVPDLQLAIAGRIDPADPVAVTVLAEIRAFAERREGLIVATDRSAATEAHVGALGRLSRCAIPASLTDEFDPEVSASLWRGTPVLAEGRGARAQVDDGFDGHYVSGVSERATRVVELAVNPRRGAELGRTGRRNAAQRNTVIRALGDELEQLALSTGTARAERPPARLAA